MALCILIYCLCAVCCEFVKKEYKTKEDGIHRNCLLLAKEEEEEEGLWVNRSVKWE
jgi:hypothetical protein